MHIESHLDVDVIAHEAEDSVTCMLSLRAPLATLDRLGQTVIVVLDRSGSMHGEPLEAAKASLQTMIRRLAPHDRFGLVVFDDQAQVVIPVKQMGDHGTAHLSALVDAVTAGGMTDLHAGYSLALREAKRALRTLGDDDTPGATLVLISDGHANSGITDPAQLRKIAHGAYRRSAITSVTIGLGLGYDELLLAEIAGGGSGNHRFAADADELPAAIAEEVEGLLDKSVLAATIRVSDCDGHLAGVSVPQDLPAWTEGGDTVIALGDLYGGEERSILVKLHTAPLAALGLATIAELAVEFTALPDQQEHRMTLPISVNVVPGDVAAKRVPSPVVVVEELLAETTRAKASASAHLRSGDTDGARRDLTTSSRRIGSLTQALDVLRKHGQLDSQTAQMLQTTLDSEQGDVDNLLADIDTKPPEYASKSAMFAATTGRTGRRRVKDDEPRCPACGGRALPIVWGLLAGDPGPDVIIGGCCLPAVPATHGCKACGWRGVL